MIIKLIYFRKKESKVAEIVNNPNFSQTMDEQVVGSIKIPEISRLHFYEIAKKDRELKMDVKDDKDAEEEKKKVKGKKAQQKTRPK